MTVQASQNAIILKHYSLLRDTGLLELLEDYKKEVKNLKNLMSHAEKLFLKESHGDLSHFLLESLVDRFIPADAWFVYQEGDEGKPVVHYYKNIKQTDNKAAMPPFLKLVELLNSPDECRFVKDMNLLSGPVKDFIQANDIELVLPLQGHNRLYGVALLSKNVLENEYSLEDKKYVDQMLKFASIAVQNIVHYRRAVTDNKTGLFNYTYFAQRLREEMYNSVRYGREFVLLMIDIDHFKKVNDNYGHLFGDKVLLELAGIIRNQLRDGDLASRFGGEEFTIIITNCDLHGGMAVAERIRKQVSKKVFKLVEKNIHISISVGGLLLPNGDSSHKEVLTKVDEALYKAKDSGRNCSVFYPDIKPD